MKRIVIFGATGPTGRILMQQALDDGHEVTAVARNPLAINVRHSRLHVLQGDVFDITSVEKALMGQDSVIAVFGLSSYTFKPVTVYSVGTMNIVQAMHNVGVQRLICVSSTGTNPYYDPQVNLFFGLLLKPIFGRTLYADMCKMEQLIMQSGLNWTIVRPGMLVNMPQLSTYRVGPGYSLPHGWRTARIDLADFLLKQVKCEEYKQEAVAIITK